MLAGLKNPIIAALDVDEVDRAIKLAENLKDSVGAVKLGPRLVLRAGSGFIKDMAKLCPVFVDFKFYDIPSTMKSAVLAVAEEGATIVTVHASAGKDALSMMTDVQNHVSKKRPFHIFAVTVLTSFSAETIPDNLKDQSISQHVVDLAKMSASVGMHNLVCSPHEIEALKGLDPRFSLITPGVRPKGADTNDQMRVMTPKEAVDLGSDALVVGRPIIQAPDPREAAQAILESLSNP